MGASGANLNLLGRDHCEKVLGRRQVHKDCLDGKGQGGICETIWGVCSSTSMASGIGDGGSLTVMRQGCALSCIAQNLLMSTLIKALSEEALNHPLVECKQTAYADDTKWQFRAHPHHAEELQQAAKDASSLAQASLPSGPQMRLCMPPPILARQGRPSRQQDVFPGCQAAKSAPR